jgi:hypothetical protein
LNQVAFQPNSLVFGQVLEVLTAIFAIGGMKAGNTISQPPIAPLPGNRSPVLVPCNVSTDGIDAVVLVTFVEVTPNHG